MEYLRHWQFWLAVVVVGFVVNLAMTYLMPKLSSGGGA